MSKPSDDEADDEADDETDDETDDEANEADNDVERDHDEDDHDEDEKGESEPEIDSFLRALARVPEAASIDRQNDRIGDKIDRFVIVERLGAGGMGVVYRAADAATGESIALKVLPAAFAEDAARARRFASEASALATLDHPAIVRYVAHGVTPEGEPFLAMEWLEGEDLGRRLRRGPLSVRETVAVGLRVAEAVAAAHARGVIHRDIKPSNLFLRALDPERVTVLDFGLARVHGASSLTATGAAIGTPGYMAPEQVRGEANANASARADLFSLGCVLFECITGAPAFGGAHPMAVLARILVDEPAKVEDMRPETPEALARLIDRMLAKRPDDRPDDAEAVARALRELRDLPEPALGALPPKSPTEARRPSAPVIDRRAIAVIVISAPRLNNSAERLSSARRNDVDRAEAAADVRRAALLYGGHVERLFDGSWVVLFALAPDGLVVDLAAQAARTALALRACAPSRSIALAMGSAQASDGAPMGPAIDHAMRLCAPAPLGRRGFEQAAAPIALDPIAARLLDARFNVLENEAGPALIGERHPDAPPRALLGRAIPFVGRDAELRLLEHVYEQWREEPAAQAVLMIAPAGAGKSRLCDELVRRVKASPEPPSIWFGRSDWLRSPTASWALGQIARGAAGIFGRERERTNDEIRSAFLASLATECARGPVMIVFDDLHACDRPTIELLERAQKELREAPLLLLALARPEISEAFPDVWAGSGLVQIRLGELPRRAIERIARYALGDDLPQATIDRLARLAEGNAFLLEELIRDEAEGRVADVPDRRALVEHFEQSGEPERAVVYLGNLGRAGSRPPA